MTGNGQITIGRRGALAGAAMAAALRPWGARAEGAAVTIGMAAAPSAIDPHYHLLATNMSVASHIFETLVRQDARQRPGPGLATGWRLVDPTTWEFDLRRDVVFHDGSPFTADDVLFSLKRVPLVPRSPSSFAIFLRGIASAEAVDAHTVRFRTKGPYPNLALDLSQVFILSAKAAAGPAPEGKTTTQLNAGDGAVGTGAYRFVSFTPGDRVVLARNDRYWGGAEPWSQVTITALPSGPTRVAALLSGQADVIEKILGEDVQSLRGNAKVALTLAPSNSVTYLCFDQARTASPGVSDAGNRNPLQDARVRRALSLAINRDGLAGRVMDGLALPAAELAEPGMFGATPGAKPDPYDPAAAKRLLADAGFPDGFGLALGTTNGFYVQDSQLGQAVAAAWTRIGVRTTLEAVPSSVFYKRRNNREFSAYMTSMSMITGQASDTLQILAATQNPAKSLGQTNFGGYSNPRVDALIEQASGTLDNGAREKLLQQASAIVVSDDHGVLPILIEKVGYASRSDLIYTPRADKWVTAMQVRTRA
jgi:peptide/nickel transport system substrate-binding protein